MAGGALYAPVELPGNSIAELVALLAMPGTMLVSLETADIVLDIACLNIVPFWFWPGTSLGSFPKPTIPPDPNDLGPLGPPMPPLLEKLLPPPLGPPRVPMWLLKSSFSSLPKLWSFFPASALTPYAFTEESALKMDLTAASAASRTALFSESPLRGSGWPRYCRHAFTTSAFLCIARRKSALPLSQTNLMSRRTFAFTCGLSRSSFFSR
mmetsp:Transcript_111634/g.349206  ORF Transcript_111634/g.349206 Transcript_111634/m.349206 type:complete len:210 (-) Transcript_111634:196-825(-)